MALDLVFFQPLAIVLALSAAITLLLTNNWRLYLLALAAQYFGVFVLVAVHWEVGLAAVKLVVGWMTVAILGSSNPGSDFQLPYAVSRTGLIFRFITITIVGLLVNVFSSNFAAWLGVDEIVAMGGLLLSAGGVLQIGFSGSGLRRIVGILSVLSGFEIIFAPLSNSVLLAGLIAFIHLGIGIAETYWINLEDSEEVSV
ncbi:MAG: hypothetical protein V2J07_03225 [Anaerolineae bacterium]|jgi:hypothetical protein|nr:hypothetical protein [Anaerolineae bacterium]